MQGVLEEALALSAALPQTETQQKREAARSSLSPSRFLQMASRPTEGPSATGQYEASPVMQLQKLSTFLAGQQHFPKA